MGWIRSAKQASGVSDPVLKPQEELEAAVEQIEYRTCPNPEPLDTNNLKELWPVQPIRKPNSELPFIPTDLVMGQSLQSQAADRGTATTMRLWIVVDEIVYDCSDFVDDHPGGQQVILSFAGHDCSWQFWRFHSRNIMEEYGRPLRVGRTKGIENQFKEFPRYIGLSKLGDDEDFYY